MPHLGSRVESRVAPRTVVPRALFAKGEYSACLSLIGDVTDPEVTLLAANCSYRLRDYSRALEFLSPIADACAQTELRYSADALAALCFMALGEESEAKVRCTRVGDAKWQRLAPASACEVEQSRALCSWMAGDFDCSQSILDGIPEIGDANVDARTHMLRAWTFGMRGDWRKQAALLISSLRLLETTSMPDVGLQANVAHALSALVRERPVLRGFEFVEKFVSEDAWTGDMDFERFQTLRSFAWSLALQGRTVHAIRAMMDARESVPSKRYGVLSHFDSAYFSMIAGDETTASAQVVHASEIALKVDWGDTKLDELATLLVGAEVLGNSSPATAGALLRLYDAHKGDFPRTLGMTHDGRMEGMESYARAVVAFGDAKPNEARRNATVAFEVFDALEFDWRAARAAILLYRVGGGERWAEVAQGKLAHYRTSFVAGELRAITTAGPSLSELTPRQREVASLLRAGSSIDEISTSLRCSRNTVRVHARRIYFKLGVSSQRELQALSE